DSGQRSRAPSRRAASALAGASERARCGTCRSSAARPANRRARGRPALVSPATLPGGSTHDLEPERAGKRRGLDETDIDRSAELERFLRPRPDQRAGRLLETEIVLAQ